MRYQVIVNKKSTKKTGKVGERKNGLTTRQKKIRVLVLLVVVSVGWPKETFCLSEIMEPSQDAHTRRRKLQRRSPSLSLLLCKHAVLCILIVCMCLCTTRTIAEASSGFESSSDRVVLLSEQQSSSSSSSSSAVAAAAASAVPPLPAVNITAEGLSNAKDWCTYMHTTKEPKVLLYNRLSKCGSTTMKLLFDTLGIERGQFIHWDAPSEYWTDLDEDHDLRASFIATVNAKMKQEKKKSILVDGHWFHTAFVETDFGGNR